MGSDMISASTATHLRGCAMYLLLYMAFGCTDPFMPLIWHSKGLSEYEIGLLGAIWPVASFLVTPVACTYADKHGIQRKMLSIALLMFTVTRPSVLMAANFLAVGAVEVLYAIAKSPINSLIDVSVRRSSGADGFGAQRLWGAVGYAVASLVGGFVCSSSGGSYGGVMVMFMAVMLGTMAASAGISVGKDYKAEIKDYWPECTDGFDSSTRTTIAEKTAGASEASSLTAVPAMRYNESNVATAIEKGAIEFGSIRKGSRGKGGSQNKEENLLFTALSLILGNLENASFFSAIILSGMGAGVIDTFLFIRLEELGGSTFLCGLARLVMCLAEVPFFYISGQLIRLIGVKGVILSAQTAYFIRFLYYSVLENPWFVLPVEVLHGLTFAAMWTASLEHAHNIAPEKLRTTMRGVVAGLHPGLGFGLGAMLGGVLYSRLGPRLCFRVSAALPSLSLFLLALPTVCRWCNNRGETLHIEEELNETSIEKDQGKENVSSIPKGEAFPSDLCDKADDEQDDDL